jgi:Uri superfamily endonuclease
VEPGLDPSRLPAEPGVYVLWLRLGRPRRLDIARLGRPLLEAGVYGYVGSARGPGGLAARLGRHLSGCGTRRWHVDHLRRAARVENAWWWVTRSPHAEDACVGILESLPDVVPSVAGFGASDSRRRTHLFFGRCVPERDAFEGRAPGGGHTGPAVRDVPGSRVVAQ